MVDLVILDGFPDDGDKKSQIDPNPKCGKAEVKKSLKRKRALFGENVSEEEKESLVSKYRREIDGLVGYFKDVLSQKVHLNDRGCYPTNTIIACLLEENHLPFSKLVEEIYEKLKSREEVTLVSVRSNVLFIGQRSMYGITNPDADVLEDDSELCLWCWETRDMKLLPKSQRGILNIRRICRKKIYERITALSAMISALLLPADQHNHKMELTKASENVGKTLNQEQICSFVETLLQKNGAVMAEKETRLKEKDLIKELERNKREAEKEKKRMDRELQKERLQSERELKRLQEEAEKEERRREKEETELKKQLKRQQDEAEKDQRRREKEEAELKRQLAVQKQASIMDRFLKSRKNNSDDQDNRLATKASTLESSAKSKMIISPVTLSMDAFLSRNDCIDTPDLFRSHRVSWNELGKSIRCNKSHWGVRHKPKVALFTELKLQGSSIEDGLSGKITTANKRFTCSEVRDVVDLYPAKVADGWEGTVAEHRSCNNNVGIPSHDMQLCNRPKKLLQFDKSHRPAYYGTLSAKSDIVGPCKPFKKDPNLDYDIESDEEWEEEDPGESLSDCDKDDEEENLEEGNLKADDDDGSDDSSFMVPDGYLSENEGVQVDGMESDVADDEVRSSPSCVQDVESEELRVLLRQQKHLQDLTEHALRRNQPLIISNLMHEKDVLMMADGLSGIPKAEQTCLQALSMRPCPGGIFIDISAYPFSLPEDGEFCESQSKDSTSHGLPVVAMLDLDLRETVLSILSCPYGMNRVVESLQKKFPVVPKTQLRTKVREVSDFVDNHWQVKKEILDKLGLSTTSEKGIARTKGIAAFFSKRCLPPAGEDVNASESESSPQPCRKPEICHDEQRVPECRLNRECTSVSCD